MAFVSSATNLVPGDTNGRDDVFVHDRQIQTTTRVNVDSSDAQAIGTINPLKIEITRIALSADGRFVAFTSDATNLVPNDFNDVTDVFVHDQVTGQTSRVNVSATGQEANNGRVFDPDSISMSADGRYVAFESWADNLVPRDDNLSPDIFVHDRQTHTTYRVPAPSYSTGSVSPSLSSDGRSVAFLSWAEDLVPGDTNNQPDVFVHDLDSSFVAVPTPGSTTDLALTMRGPSVVRAGKNVVYKIGVRN